MATGIETEIKLLTTPARLRALAMSPELHGDSRTRTLDTIYYDTSDHRLTQKHLSMRVRCVDARCQQTFKAPITGPFARHEANVAIDGPDLDLDAFGPAIRAQLDDASGSAPLAPQFSVRVSREEREINRPRAVIEAAFDTGLISAADHQAPICELELELKSGNPAALYELALMLPLGDDLCWSLSSKSERGFALLRPSEARARKAQPLLLAPDSNIGDARRALTGHALEHLLRHYRLVAVQRNAAALHQSRLALRRLAGALSLFAPVSDPAIVAQLRAELRDVMASLAPARHADVALARFDRTHGNDHPLHAQLRRRRADALRAAASAISGASFQRLMFGLAMWSEDAEPGHQHDPRPLSELAQPQLKRLWRKFGRAAIDLEQATPKERHRLRIIAKKLAQAVEAFGGLYPKPRAQQRVAALAAALATLREALGELNDSADLRADRPLGRPASPTRAAWNTWLETLALEDASALKSAQSACATLRAARPFW